MMQPNHNVGLLKPQVAPLPPPHHVYMATKGIICPPLIPRASPSVFAFSPVYCHVNQQDNPHAHSHS